MKRIALAIGIATLAAPVLAGPMQDACLARGTWDDATCVCMQGVADEILSPQNQELGAAYFSRQITSQQIAAQHGAGVAEDFLNKIAEFMSEATKECGAP